MKLIDYKVIFSCNYIIVTKTKNRNVLVLKELNSVGIFFLSVKLLMSWKKRKAQIRNLLTH